MNRLGYYIITVMMAVAISCCSVSCLADSFLTDPGYDMGTISIPKDPSIQIISQFLDKNSDYFVHAGALEQFNGYECNEKLISLLKKRLHDLDSPLRLFDLGYILVFNSDYCQLPVCSNPDHFDIHKLTKECRTEKNEMANEGLLLLEQSLKKDRNSSQMLCYALCLAQVEAFLLHRPWDKLTKEKKEVISLIEEAMTLNGKRKQRGFDITIQKVIKYMVLYDGYKPLNKYIQGGIAK